MTKEDKLLLLADILDCDVSSFVKDKKDEFLKTSVMIEIDDILKKDIKKDSPRYQELYEEYKELIHAKINSIEDYFVLMGKANNLLSMFKNNKYVNPLFSFDENEEYPLSKVILNFDGKDETLGDIVMKENYSSQYKIDCIKEYIIKWNKEVKSRFIYPLEALISYPKNLPVRKHIPFSKKVYGAFLLIINIILTIILFFSNGYIFNVLRGEYVREYFAIPMVALYYIVFISNFLYCFSLLRRFKYVKKYLEGLSLFFDNTYSIMKKLDNSTERLYKDILNCIVHKVEVTGLINKYSNLINEYRTFLYMKRINEKTSLREDLLFTYEIILIQIIVITIVYLIVCALLILGGILL